MKKIETRLVQSESADPDCSGAASVPIYQTATFDIDNPSGLDYSRSGNPTRTVLEHQLADLEDASRSLVYNSGVAAVDAVLSLVPHGQEIVVADDLYGGTSRLLDLHKRQRGIEVTFFETGNAASLQSVISPRTRLVLVELPSNPFMVWTDVAEVAKICNKAGALLAVDYSMMSPLASRPLADGADIAIQSATKFLGGHSDLTAGVVSVADASLGDELYYNQNAQGVAAGPFECWLLLRGLKTLSVRLNQQIRNTKEVVDHLLQRDDVLEIYWPGLSDRPGEPCPVFSIRLNNIDTVESILKSTKLFRTSVSFGGVSSSISAPSVMSHACVKTLSCSTGVVDDCLVRLSIGIEAVEDLIADLDSALNESLCCPTNAFTEVAL